MTSQTVRPVSGEFTASLDRTTRIVSALILGLGIVLPLLFWQTPIAAGFSFVVMFLTCFIAYGLSARGYSVDGREIRVRRLFGDVVIPLENVSRAEVAANGALNGAIRLAGSGGFFGYYGLYRTSELGVCRWFVTNRENAVVVSADGKTYVFSPDEAAGFVAAVRSVVSVQSADPGPATFRSYVTARGVWSVLAIVAGVVALIFVVLAYDPGPPRFTLTRESLVVHDRFYPVTLLREEVDLANVRVLNLRTETQWRPTIRTNGFSNAHYHSGWFRVSGGQSVRIYRANRSVLVLLPGKGTSEATMLEVADPDGFVRDLRNLWH